MGDLTGYTIVFDLDGTLIDTALDLIAAVNHILETMGHRPVDDAALRQVISFGGRHMIETALVLRGQQPSPLEIDHLFLRFAAYYSANIAVHSRPFPGLIAQLDRLAERGALLAVCTNKREDLATQLMVELNMLDRFAALTGRDTFPVHKPHPGHLLNTIDKAGGDRNRAIMIGDSDTDVQTAKAANIPVIGATFGYTDVPVTELGCDAVIAHYEQFEPALARLLT